MKKPRIILMTLSWMLFVIFLVIVSCSDQKETQEKQSVTEETQNVTETPQDNVEIIREYREARFTFNIQNGNIRFSHGNHKGRERWFQAYFGTGYDDCGVCHNLGLPTVDEYYSVVPGEGEPLNTVEAIREYKNDIFPYGIQEQTCLSSCHDNVTAPNDCEWCHVPDSKPLQQVEMAEGKVLPGPGPGWLTEAAFAEETEEEPASEEETDRITEEVERILPDYDEEALGDPDNRDYKEKAWFFDIFNHNVRFSHGNHASRERWFKVYFGTGYDDCGNCHNLGLPFVAEGGVMLEDGDHLNTVEDIREYEDDMYPFGIMMARCFGACHNGLTASNECVNCHLPESKPLSEGLTEREM